MRLICPNCGAQYAVDARVIPDAGRDVQCSSCGHTWFQKHPDQDAELAEELGYALPDSLRGTASEPPPPPRTSPVAEEEAPAEEPAEEPVAEAPQPEHVDVEAVEDAAQEVEPEPTEEPEADPSALEDVPPRRKVDEAALSVLREEAEREQAARRAEAAVPEVQPELEIPAPPVAPHRGTAGYAPEAPQIRPEPEPEEVPEATEPEEVAQEEAMRPAPRRERLPDVEEITSTLEPTEADVQLSLIHISEPTRHICLSRMPSSA